MGSKGLPGYGQEETVEVLRGIADVVGHLGQSDGPPKVGFDVSDGHGYGIRRLHAHPPPGGYTGLPRARLTLFALLGLAPGRPLQNLGLGVGAVDLGHLDANLLADQPGPTLHVENIAFDAGDAVPEVRDVGFLHLDL